MRRLFLALCPLFPLLALAPVPGAGTVHASDLPLCGCDPEDIGECTAEAWPEGSPLLDRITDAVLSGGELPEEAEAWSLLVENPAGCLPDDEVLNDGSGLALAMAWAPTIAKPTRAECNALAFRLRNTSKPSISDLTLWNRCVEARLIGDTEDGGGGYDASEAEPAEPIWE